MWYVMRRRQIGHSLLRNLRNGRIIAVDRATRKRGQCEAPGLLMLLTRSVYLAQ